MNNPIKILGKKVYDWLDTYYSEDDKLIIRDLQDKLNQAYALTDGVKESCAIESQKLSNQNTVLQNQILTLNQALKDAKEVQEYLGLTIPADAVEILKYYDNKYPKQEYLTYTGLPIKLVDGTESRPEIALCDYITALPSIKKYVLDNKLDFATYMKKYQDFKIAMDKCREDIYKKVVTLKQYIYDSELFGSNEFWSGPLISWYLKVGNVRKMDCEDSSLLLMSFYAAAGVPRGFQRAAGGMTRAGYGHATVLVYSFSQSKWLQYETTVTSPMICDAKDPVKNHVIVTTWFSFDDKYTWAKNPADMVAYKTSPASIKPV